MKSKDLRSILNCRVRGLLPALALAAMTLGVAITLGNAQDLTLEHAPELPKLSRTIHNLRLSKPALPISWTCNGTIALTGTSYSYALPPWTMSGGIGADREKKCKEFILANWINNGAIWKQLGIPASQQEAFCKSGGTFRVDYGFDKRKKDWNFVQSGKPVCRCTGPLSFS